MLQRLLQGASSKSAATGQETPAIGQKSPGAAALSGCGGPQMSGPTMDGMMQLQTQPASASDVAAQLVSQLDTDGDGQVSITEIQQALANAGKDSDVSRAFTSIDQNADGKLSSQELTNALSASRHHRHGHNAAQAAATLTSAFDQDGDGALSLDEVGAAVGQSGADASSDIGQGFASLDANGDGKLSADEISAAIQTRIEAALKAYAQQPNQGATLAASA
jgi:Ca2+-binding EF-hand superfamily protein